MIQRVRNHSLPSNYRPSATFNLVGDYTKQRFNIHTFTYTSMLGMSACRGIPVITSSLFRFPINENVSVYCAGVCMDFTCRRLGVADCSSSVPELCCGFEGPKRCSNAEHSPEVSLWTGQTRPPQPASPEPQEAALQWGLWKPLCYGPHHGSGRPWTCSSAAGTSPESSYSGTTPQLHLSLHRKSAKETVCLVM